MYRSHMFCIDPVWTLGCDASVLAQAWPYPQYNSSCLPTRILNHPVYGRPKGEPRRDSVAVTADAGLLGRVPWELYQVTWYHGSQVTCYRGSQGTLPSNPASSVTATESRRGSPFGHTYTGWFSFEQANGNHCSEDFSEGR